MSIEIVVTTPGAAIMARDLAGAKKWHNYGRQLVLTDGQSWTFYLALAGGGKVYGPKRVTGYSAGFGGEVENNGLWGPVEVSADPPDNRLEGNGVIYPPTQKTTGFTRG